MNPQSPMPTPTQTPPTPEPTPPTPPAGGPTEPAPLPTPPSGLVSGEPTKKSNNKMLLWVGVVVVLAIIAWLLFK